MIKYINPTSRTIEFQANKEGELIYYIPNTERVAFFGLGVLTGLFVSLATLLVVYFLVKDKLF